MRPSAGRAALASAALASAALASAALACASHPDALARGQRYYEDNQYERALALWRDLVGAAEKTPHPQHATA